MAFYEEYIQTPEAIWFDKVPSAWKVTKMREIFSERDEKVSDKEYPVPPIEEQDQIAEFVEAEEAKAQRATLAIKQEISLLREYRIRLISDVVTGQIDVRGIEIPEYTPIEDMEIDMNTGSYEEVEADAD